MIYVKIQIVIDICENSSLKPSNDTKVFIEYQNDMGDMVDDMVADMLSNKKLKQLKKANHSSFFY